LKDDIAYLTQVCGQMKERVHKVDEILENSRFFFEKPSYDMDIVSKKYKSENSAYFVQIADKLRSCQNPSDIEQAIKGYITDNALKMGEIMPIMRIAVCGTMQGPDLVQTIYILGVDESADRIERAINVFDKE
jgi:glutamyl-tRNA synthetase